MHKFIHVCCVVIAMYHDHCPCCAANQYKVSLKHSGGPPLLPAVSTYGRVDVTFVGADGINETIPLTRYGPL